MTFGDCRLDLGTRQLFRGTAEVHLSPKAFELLHVLIENRARAMSKAELQEKLWPATFVTEANLASLIAEIRRGLDDRSREPRFVRTVHRFGYAFSGTISDAPQASPRHSCWIVWRGRELPMTDGENIIGRDPAARVPLDFPSVSRRHARLVVASDRVTVEDLDSKNGTFLRKERVTGPQIVQDLDELQVGSVALTVRILRSGESTQTIDL